MEPIYRVFGARLRESRQAAGLSQAAIADRVGLTRASVSNIELGRQRLPLHLVYELAHAVGLSPTELLPEPSSKSSEEAWIQEILGAPA